MPEQLTLRKRRLGASKSKVAKVDVSTKCFCQGERGSPAEVVMSIV
jgi:hypothetical protein